MQRKAMRIVFAAALCALAAAVTVVCVIMNRENSAALVTVDGEKVYAEEMEFYILQERASVIQRFSDENSVLSDKAFWTEEQNGETPAEVLIESALEVLRLDKALLVDCEKRGLCGRLDFNRIKENMEAENKERSEAVKEGRPVYGVSEFNLSTYFDYLKTNLRIKQKEQLSEEKLFETDEIALKQFYGTVRDTDPLFKNKEGGYRPYSEVHAKVKYLYEEKIYSDYMKKLTEKQNVTRDDAALLRLVTEIV